MNITCTLTDHGTRTPITSFPNTITITVNTSISITTTKIYEAMADDMTIDNMNNITTAISVSNNATQINETPSSRK